MLRVIFDTNVYGRLAELSDRDILIQRIRENKEFIVYSFGLIRKELRNIPRTTKESKRNRARVLTLYDRITGRHTLRNSIQITELAKKYFNRYRSLGGIHDWNTNIQVDFLIVACASYHRLDIVYSDDQKTMTDKIAQKCYKQINLKHNVSTPTFLRVEDLLRKFRGQL